MHGEIYQPLEAVAAPAACAVPPWWLWRGHGSAPMPREIKPNRASHASNAGIEAGWSAEHSIRFSCSPQLSCQLQSVLGSHLKLWISQDTDKIQNSTQGRAMKVCFQWFKMLHFSLALFSMFCYCSFHKCFIFLKEAPQSSKSRPKFKLTAFLVQLTSQRSQILKHNKAEKKKKRGKEAKWYLGIYLSFPRNRHLQPYRYLWKSYIDIFSWMNTTIKSPSACRTHL